MRKFAHPSLALVAAFLFGCQQTIPANQKYESGAWGRVTFDGQNAHEFGSGTSTSTGPRLKICERQLSARLMAALSLSSATQKGITPNTQIELHIPGTLLGTTLHYTVQADDKNRYLIREGKQRVMDPISNSMEHYKELCTKEIDKDIETALGLSN